MVLFLLAAGSAWGQKHAECSLVRGDNSELSMHNLRFETLVDVFSVVNARTLYLELDGEPMKFLRSEIDVERRQTRLIYLLRKKNKAVRAARVVLDRTPKEARIKGEFYGHVQITDEMKDGIISSLPRTYSYNFYCSF